MMVVLLNTYGGYAKKVISPIPFNTGFALHWAYPNASHFAKAENVRRREE